VRDVEHWVLMDPTSMGTLFSLLDELILFLI
jgi:hypothetical protein